MLQFFSKIEFQDEDRSRRSLITSSLMLMIFSNIQLRNDSLKILGLEIVVSEESIVAVLKLVVLLSLVAFLAIQAAKLPRLIARQMKKRDERWWSPISREIDDYHAQGDSDYNHMIEQEAAAAQYRDWDDDALAEWHSRKQKRIKVQSYYRTIVTFTKTISRIAWPLSLAVVALCAPQLFLVLDGN